MGIGRRSRNSSICLALGQRFPRGHWWGIQLGKRLGFTHLLTCS